MSLMFGLRFDFRNPAFAGTTPADRYAAALDMAEWADGIGGVVIAVSEHHGSADGYVPSPLPIVAAMAARTTNVRFSVAALIAPFYDPLRVAEGGGLGVDPGRDLAQLTPGRARDHRLDATRRRVREQRAAAERLVVRMGDRHQQAFVHGPRMPQRYAPARPDQPSRLAWNSMPLPFLQSNVPTFFG